METIVRSLTTWGRTGAQLGQQFTDVATPRPTDNRALRRRLPAARLVIPSRASALGPAPCNFLGRIGKFYMHLRRQRKALSLVRLPPVFAISI